MTIPEANTILKSQGRFERLARLTRSSGLIDPVEIQPGTVFVIGGAGVAMAMRRLGAA